MLSHLDYETGIKQIMISQRNFYNSIFNWNYLIKNGYFDFKNTSIWYKGEIQNEYGQDDVIDVFCK